MTLEYLIFLTSYKKRVSDSRLRVSTTACYRRGELTPIPQLVAIIVSLGISPY